MVTVQDQPKQGCPILRKPNVKKNLNLENRKIRELLHHKWILLQN